MNHQLDALSTCKPLCHQCLFFIKWTPGARFSKAPELKLSGTFEKQASVLWSARPNEKRAVVGRVFPLRVPHSNARAVYAPAACFACSSALNRTVALQTTQCVSFTVFVRNSVMPGVLFAGTSRSCYLDFASGFSVLWLAVFSMAWYNPRKSKWKYVSLGD